LSTEVPVDKRQFHETSGRFTTRVVNLPGTHPLRTLVR
jgi:hypothetical protein